MSALNREQAIPQAIGQVIILPNYHSIEAVLRGAVKELDENYSLRTEEEFVKGPLIKYGILDMTFQNRKTTQFLKIYCEADTGYFPSIKKTGKEVDLDEMRAYIFGHFKNIELLFPIRVEIIDCCFTNDEWIWAEKYFYV
jgi:hypothetical protein